MESNIAITGISGRFPKSENIDEFKYNLFNNIDMVDNNETRWPSGLYGLPTRLGKLNKLNKFDATFFQIDKEKADLMDPQIRIMLEVTYESILDAGVIPEKLRATRTGVFIGATLSDFNPMFESNSYIHTDLEQIKLFNASISNYISYQFDFRGPSLTVDTACSSSALAFEQAILSIKNGQCENAIVGGSNLCVDPVRSLNFFKMNMLSTNGKCKFMDESADGYVRSETCSVIFLQKVENAKRIYATIINIGERSDGYKIEGITYPSSISQGILMKQTLDQAGIDTREINYIESHGTGTVAGDSSELNAIVEVFCKDRTEPLLVGSVKTNCGHSEPGAGMCSIIKVLLMFEEKIIPASLNFSKANTEILGLKERHLKPIRENQMFFDSVVPINSFGFGGVCVNILLKPFENTNISEYRNQIENIPRLIFVSSRTEESIQHIFEFIENNRNNVTEDFIALMNEISKTDADSGMKFRGHILFGKNYENNEILNRNISEFTEKRPLWFIFPGVGSQWTSMAKGMMDLNIFSETIFKIDNVLKQHDIDILNILNDQNKDEKQTVAKVLISIIAVEIALVELLKQLDIKPDGFIGHSVGEIMCGYQDQCLTIDEAILTLHALGNCIENYNCKNGLMAVVGLSWEEAFKRCPEGVVPACDNSENLITIAGEFQITKMFLEELNQDNIYFKILDSCETAFHSFYMEDIRPEFISKSDKIILNKKTRSSKWISTSIPEDKWDRDYAKYSNGSYFANNLISPVYFKDAIKKIPYNAIVLEIGPQSLFGSIIRRHSTEMTYISLMKKNNNDQNLQYFLSSIGSLYELGFNPNIEMLYPKISYPVKRGTQSISSLIKWDHTENHFFQSYPEFFNPRNHSIKIRIDLKNEKYNYLNDFIIDGKIYFPVAGYLIMMMQVLCEKLCQIYENVSVVFENVSLKEQVFFPENGEIEFVCEFQYETGDFKIENLGNIIISGRFELRKNCLIFQHLLMEVHHEKDYAMTSYDIYEDLFKRGYEFGENYQSLLRVSTDCYDGVNIYNGNFVTYFDSLMQLKILEYPRSEFNLPIYFESISIDLSCLLFYNEINVENYLIHNELNNVYVTTGIEIKGAEFYDYSLELCNLSNCEQLDIENIQFSKHFVETEHAYLSMEKCCGISTFSWVEADHKHVNLALNGGEFNQSFFHVYFAPINYVDSIKYEKFTSIHSKSKTENKFGIEFVGRDRNGNRVMGIANTHGLATTIPLDEIKLLWPIPNKWTMEEACSIPVAYVSALYILVIRGKIHKGETILINDCGNSIGQAAIWLALYTGCNVFLLAKTNKEKSILMKEFPSLIEKQVIVARSDLENIILRQTHYIGIDIFIDLLPEVGPNSNFKCLAQHGRYLRTQNGRTESKSIGMNVFLKNITFEGINLDDLFAKTNFQFSNMKKRSTKIHKLILKGMENGMVRPLSRRIFLVDQIEDAFKIFKSGENFGKLIIQLRKEEEIYGKQSDFMVRAIPSLVFVSQKTYLILLWSLNDFGLELINWLLKHGARKIMININSGIQYSYQYHYLKRIKRFSEKIKVFHHDLWDTEDIQELFEEATQMGTIDGFFNLLLIDEYSKKYLMSNCDKISEINILANNLSKIYFPHMDYFVIMCNFKDEMKNCLFEYYSRKICEERNNNGSSGIYIQLNVIKEIKKLKNRDFTFNRLDQKIIKRILLILKNVILVKNKHEQTIDI